MHKEPPFVCPWCKGTHRDYVADEHLIILKNENHYHIHGPIEKREELEIMIEELQKLLDEMNKEVGEELKTKKQEKIYIDNKGDIYVGGEDNNCNNTGCGGLNNTSDQIPVIEDTIGSQSLNQTVILPTQSFNTQRKIIFSHRRALGDALMFTCGIRDFKLLFPDILINVDTNMPEVFENNPYIDRSIKRFDPGVEYYKVGYSAIASANNTYLHFTNMFLLDMIAAADLTNRLPLRLGEFCASFANGEVGDPDLGNPSKNSEAREPFISIRKKYRHFCQKFSRMYADIHLTDQEKKKNIVRDIYGISIPYWVIAPGGKRDCTSKIWDWRRFVDVVKYFEGRIQFVTIGRSDLIVESIPGVLDLTDKFNNKIRDLFSLIYNAEGCVSGPTFLMHAAAAMPVKPGKGRMPCVTIIGGREPVGWTWYTNHQILHTNGIMSCCSSGGCWTARTYPIPKDPKHNLNLCKRPIESNGRTIQSCMDLITSADVIRAIERYYEGDLYQYPKVKPSDIVIDVTPKTVDTAFEKNNTQNDKIINLLGNLHVDGGGEQSLCMIARVLNNAGWTPKLYSWRGIHPKFKDMFHDLVFNNVFQKETFESGMLEAMSPDVPLLFYANDRTRDFCEKGQDIVAKSSKVIIGINYMNRPIVTCSWLSLTNKVVAFIFQNREKAQEFEKESIGFERAKKIVLFGAIDIDKFLRICTPERKDGEPLIALKHCVPDYRKYVTAESEGKGKKVHLWQHHLAKDRDVKFYGRLLKEIPEIKFEFMEAHSELVEAFRNEPRMVFHKWDSMPVTKFLQRGHIYLYRTSNLWRDQYPRVVAEALAAGLPILSEPRDGTKDRIDHGNTGFYCIDYDAYKYAIKLLIRKEKYRYEMCRNAKDWARVNLDPRKWAEVISDVLRDS